MLRPSTRAGRPALGMALSGFSDTATMRSMASSVVFGPTEQLMPMTSTGQEFISRVKTSGVAPPARFPKSSMVTCAMITTSSPAASRAAKTASRSSFRSEKVSRHEQIDAGRQQRCGLLAKNRAGFARTTSAPAVRCERQAARSRRRQTDLPAQASRARRTPASIDGLQLVGETECGEPRTVGSEGVGFENLRAGIHVVAVNAAHQIGSG